MIIIAFVLIGAVSGILMARRRGGTRLDMAQHAATLAIIGAVLGMFASIALARLL